MRKRSAIIVSLCLAVSLFALAGCEASEEEFKLESKEPTIAAPIIGEDGVLRVGVNAESSPLAGMSSGEIAGIDVDVAAYVADELGLKLSVVDVGNDATGAVNEGTVDIVMGVNDESEAFENLWTSSQYLPKGVALFALTSSNAAEPTSTGGIKIAAQASSTSAWAVANFFEEDVLVSTADLQEAFDLLSEHEVDYVAADAVVGLYSARVQEIDVSIIALLTTPDGYHIGVSNENPELQTAINDALNAVIYDGIVDVIEKKWLGSVVDLDAVGRLALTIVY